MHSLMQKVLFFKYYQQYGCYSFLNLQNFTMTAGKFFFWTMVHCFYMKVIPLVDEIEIF